MASKSWTIPVPESEQANRQFDWNDIRLFVLVAQSGSFRRASSISDKSVNSLRRRIKQLEHRLRCRLFVRDVHGAHLTERGSRLFDASQRMLNASHDVGAELQRQADDPRLSVTLNVCEGLAVYWLAPRLAEFHSANPDTRIELGCLSGPLGTDELKSDVQIQHAPPSQNDLMMVRLGHVHEQLLDRAPQPLWRNCGSFHLWNCPPRATVNAAKSRKACSTGPSHCALSTPVRNTRQSAMAHA
ncbi:MAG: LysR family transcriptional regulator [Rhizobiaceae bacterium]